MNLNKESRQPWNIIIVSIAYIGVGKLYNIERLHAAKVQMGRHKTWCDAISIANENEQLKSSGMPTTQPVDVVSCKLTTHWGAKYRSHFLLQWRLCEIPVGARYDKQDVEDSCGAVSVK